MTPLQAKGDDTVATLRKENVWSCDMSASTHATWNSKCTKNVCNRNMYSLGHTDEAMESTNIIDIP